MAYELRFQRELSEIQNVREMTPMAYNQFIFFGAGGRDNYCPYTGRFDLLGPGGSPMCAFPSDKYYFQLLQQMVAYVNPIVLYTDVQWVFRNSGEIGKPGQISLDFIQALRDRSIVYGELSSIFFNVMLHIYYGMIAENSQENTRLGSRLKLNGVYELLFGRGDVAYAADCNRGKNVAQIDAECRSRGIFDPNF